MTKLDSKRDLYSLPEDSHYLNGAYMSPLSKRVEQAGIDGIRRKCVPQGIESRHFFDEANEVRRRFAELIGADAPERIAIVPSASYGFAQVARNTALRPGQSIVIVAEDFPSNVYIWRRLCEENRGQLKIVSPPIVGAGRAEAWNAAVLSAIDGDTALVTLGQVAWTDGMRFDLDRIGERAREVGAVLVVDGSQSIGAIPFDVKRIRPDALVCPAYKWLLGPYSIGLVYFGSRFDDGEPIEQSWIVREGSEDFAGLVNYTDRYRPGAIRYDVGETSNFILMPMLAAALEQVLEWRPESVQAYGHQLTDGLVDRLRDTGFDVTEDRYRSGHLFGFRMPDQIDPRALRDRLQAERVYVSVRGNAVRVSAHLYNDESDIDALENALTRRGG